MTRTVTWLATAAAIMATMLVVGFLAFTHAIGRVQPAADVSADGIVALTGGKDRIARAVRLLADGRAKRLLITGVYRKTGKRALARLVPTSERLFACCIDIGHEALNTVGNADETRAWTRRHGFTSLIIVTSSYHMPRSLAELSRAMPDVRFVPYPVTPRNVRVDAWWAYPGTARLLVSEYVKFLPAAARLGLSRLIGSSSSDPLTARADTGSGPAGIRQPR